MPEEISKAQLEAAEKHLLEVKKTGDVEDKKAAMDAVSALRQAFRLQEEAAGRRSGMVGGDATTQ